MDKMNQKMKKLVNLRGVLDGLRTSASTPPKGSDIEVEERLRSEHFQVAKVFLTILLEYVLSLVFKSVVYVVKSRMLR